MRFALAALLAAAAAQASADPLEGKPSSSEVLAAAAPEAWAQSDPENTVYLELEAGRVVIVLSQHLAQNHVKRFKELARAGFYDGLTFYRVIDGFVAQGGDLFETRANERPPLIAEFDEAPREKLPFAPVADPDGYASQAGFVGILPTGRALTSERVWHLHCTGAVAMARDEGRDTAGTEFYIALQPQRYLDRNLSVFGRVVRGMEHVQRLRRVAPAQSPQDDLGERIIAVRVAADLPEEERTQIEWLRPGTDSFEAYVEARRNRPEGFFYYRPGHIDICQLPIPLREVEGS